jgi:hypothetical protein
MADVVEKTSNAPKIKSRRDDRCCRKNIKRLEKQNPEGTADVVEKISNASKNKIPKG